MRGILIPVKRLEESKARLARHLDASVRERLGLAMLADVLEAASGSAGIFLVTSDPKAADLGRSFGGLVVPDAGEGLNAALLAGTHHAAQCGIASLLVLPADVPLVTPGDLDAIMSCPSPVGVVPSPDGGTAALYRRPPSAIATRFGPASARAHLEEARLAGIEAQTMHLRSLSLDIDGYSDLRLLAGSGSGRQSARLARELTGGAA